MIEERNYLVNLEETQRLTANEVDRQFREVSQALQLLEHGVGVKPLTVSKVGLLTDLDISAGYECYSRDCCLKKL